MQLQGPGKRRHSLGQLQQIEGIGSAVAFGFVSASALAGLSLSVDEPFLQGIFPRRELG